MRKKTKEEYKEELLKALQEAKEDYLKNGIQEDKVIGFLYTTMTIKYGKAYSPLPVDLSILQTNDDCVKIADDHIGRVFNLLMGLPPIR